MPTQLRDEGIPLCNYTDGGEGCSGRIATPATRARLSIGNRGKVRTPEMRARTSLAKKNPSAETRAKLALIKGMAGKKHSAETKAKMSAAHKGNTYARGCKHGPISEETRAKISASKIGKKRPPFSAQHLELLRIRALGNKRGAGNRSRLGHKASAETKAKMSEAQRLRWIQRKLLTSKK